MPRPFRRRNFRRPPHMTIEPKGDSRSRRPADAAAQSRRTPVAPVSILMVDGHSITRGGLATSPGRGGLPDFTFPDLPGPAAPEARRHPGRGGLRASGGKPLVEILPPDREFHPWGHPPPRRSRTVRTRPQRHVAPAIGNGEPFPLAPGMCRRVTPEALTPDPVGRPADDGQGLFRWRPLLP